MMKDDIKDGGPAFAAAAGTATEMDLQPGMTLRDWFAGQALTAATMYQTMTPEDLAHDAYRIADAMLAEREKGQ